MLKRKIPNRYTVENINQVFSDNQATLIEDLPESFTRDTKCKFRCPCKKEHERSLRSIIERCGPVCTTCEQHQKHKSTYENNINQLFQRANEDQAQIINIKVGDILIESTVVKFICQCLSEDEKTFKSIMKYAGLKCSTCSLKSASIKKRKIPINESEVIVYSKNIELLKQIQERDQAIIDYEKIDIDKLSRDSNIEFECGECSTIDHKSFRSIVEGEGCICFNCVRNSIDKSSDWSLQKLQEICLTSQTSMLSNLTTEQIDPFIDIKLKCQCGDEFISCFKQIKIFDAKCKNCYDNYIDQTYRIPNQELQQDIENIISQHCTSTEKILQIQYLFNTNNMFKNFINLKIQYCKKNDNDRKLIRKFNSQFDIKVEDILQLIIEQNMRCKFSNMKLDFYSGAKYMMSIDRKNNEESYVKNNIQLIIISLNTPKMSTNKFQMIKQYINNQITIEFPYEKYKIDFDTFMNIIDLDFHTSYSNVRTQKQIEIDEKEQMKTCSKCNIRKSYKEYYSDKSKRDGLGTVCSNCNKSKTGYKRKIQLDTIRDKINVLMESCFKSSKTRQKNRPNEQHLIQDQEYPEYSELLFQIFFNLYKKQQGRCCLTNIPLQFEGESFICSLDRIDNSKGYFYDNIRLIIFELNCGEIEGSEHGHLTYEDLKQFCQL
jgi:hypothetical protein